MRLIHSRKVTAIAIRICVIAIVIGVLLSIPLLSSLLKNEANSPFSNDAQPPSPTPLSDDLAEIPSSISVPITDASVVAGQSLKITQITLLKTPHSLNAVSVTVKNVSSAAQYGVVWYILATPGDPEPWKHASYAAPEQAIDNLPPGQSLSFTLGEPTTHLSGFYSLSVWVHSIDKSSGTRKHSDGVPYVTPLFLGPQFSFSVDNVQVTLSKLQQETNRDFDVAVTFSARNNTDSEVRFALSFSITPSNKKPLLQFAVYTMPFKSISVGPTESYTVTYRQSVHLEPGSYTVTGRFQRVADGGQIALDDFSYAKVLDIP